MAVELHLPSSDLTLKWTTFTEAEFEAGMSRIYGGIHFDKANVGGAEMGRKVGGQVFEKAQKYRLGQT